MVYYDINKYDHHETPWTSKNIVTKRAPNLNAHSTHPHPWAPPSPWEGHFLINTTVDRIYRGNPTEIIPIRDIYKENGFWHNLVTFTRRASLIGKVLQICQTWKDNYWSLWTTSGAFVCAWDYALIPWVSNECFIQVGSLERIIHPHFILRPTLGKHSWLGAHT